MHIHITRDSDVLALHQTKGVKEWKRISIDQMQSALESLKGEPDIVVFCSADDPDQFAVDPPKTSKLIVKMILAHNLPVKFLRTPLHPISTRPGQEKAHEEQRKPSDYDVSAVLKVSALKSGDIQADGKPVTLNELDSLLASHASRNGVVWYYRENSRAEPPPQALAALELIMKHKRPFSMSSKADFSDAIDQDGNSQPREQ